MYSTTDSVHIQRDAGIRLESQACMCISRHELEQNGPVLLYAIDRSLREDRTLLCVNNFIRLTDTVEHAGARLPAMGPRFAEPLTDTVWYHISDTDPFLGRFHFFLLVMCYKIKNVYIKLFPVFF